MDRNVKALLRDIYDEIVDQRDGRPAPAWEIELRDAFLERIRAESAVSLLEVGAAAGDDSVYFAEQGMRVVSTDLSPAMVERCREKGLEAHVMAVDDLRFDADTFDAVYAKNCIAHVPNREVGQALGELARVLEPGGILYLSVYGGAEFEGIWEGDSFERKRFFSFRTDEQLRVLVTRSFEVESFDRIMQGFGGYHYQSLVLRKR